MKSRSPVFASGTRTAPHAPEPPAPPLAVAPRPVPPDVARLLRTGPFPEALRAAIVARGLSLDRIQDRLRRHGTPVSTATLSCWQSGRYRPERPNSLAALAALEEVLRLPEGALAALLGPPRPRGRWLPGTSPHTVARVWPECVDDTGALRVNTRWDGSLTRLSCTVRLELDELGRERAKWHRQLVRADCDGPDRWLTFHRLDRPGELPRLRVASPCRVGRVVEDRESGLLVAEILFEEPLTRGQTAIVEYTFEHGSARPYSTKVESILHVPVREYVLEVHFDPAALPANIHAFRTADLDSPPQKKMLRLDAAGCVHTVALTAGPCRIGIRWNWE